jgi:hypothetical protein
MRSALRRPANLIGWPEANRIIHSVEFDGKAKHLYRLAWEEFKKALDGTESLSKQRAEARLLCGFWGTATAFPGLVKSYRRHNGVCQARRYLKGRAVGPVGGGELNGAPSSFSTCRADFVSSPFSSSKAKPGGALVNIGLVVERNQD